MAKAAKKRIPVKKAAPVKEDKPVHHAAHAHEPKPERIRRRLEGQSLEDWEKDAKAAGNKIIHTGHHPIEVPDNG